MCKYADAIRERRVDGATAMAMDDEALGAALDEDDGGRVAAVRKLLAAVDKAKIEAPAGMRM